MNREVRATAEPVNCHLSGGVTKGASAFGMRGASTLHRGCYGGRVLPLFASTSSSRGWCESAGKPLLLIRISELRPKERESQRDSGPKTDPG